MTTASNDLKPMRPTAGDHRIPAGGRRAYLMAREARAAKHSKSWQPRPKSP